MKNQSSALLAFAALALFAIPASAATLDRIKDTGRIKLGYLPDASPFTSRGSSGSPEGYGIQLCEAIVHQFKVQLGLPDIAVDWVAVTSENRFTEVQQGNIDLLCTPASESLTHRKQVAFSLPVFAGGNRAVLRADAPAALRHTLSGERPDKPVWRGSPAARLLADTRYTVVPGTSTEAWLKERGRDLGIKAKVIPAPDYRAGVQMVLDRKADVFFGDRAVVLGAIDPANRDKLVVVDRLFTHEQAGFALARGDDDFRLAVDTALTTIYPSKNFSDLFARWFGPLDDRAKTFFLWSTPAQ
ncbi:MAG TPA: amino acid ABC transporter substrate-binding protein [Steroidobacteraceae bacterium]|nr:amino acid ABC transporter substrate-binding protein [Steroidobacteraceae bacterium]